MAGAAAGAGQREAHLRRADLDGLEWAFQGSRPSILELVWGRTRLPAAAIAYGPNSLFLGLAAEGPGAKGRPLAHRCIVSEHLVLIPLLDSMGDETLLDMPTRVVEFRDEVMRFLRRSALPVDGAFSVGGVSGSLRPDELVDSIHELLELHDRSDETAALCGGVPAALGEDFASVGGDAGDPDGGIPQPPPPGKAGPPVRHPLVAPGGPPPGLPPAVARPPPPGAGVELDSDLAGLSEERLENALARVLARMAPGGFPPPADPVQPARLAGQGPAGVGLFDREAFAVGLDAGTAASLAAAAGAAPGLGDVGGVRRPLAAPAPLASRDRELEAVPPLAGESAAARAAAARGAAFAAGPLAPPPRHSPPPARHPDSEIADLLRAVLLRGRSDEDGEAGAAQAQGARGFSRREAYLRALTDRPASFVDEFRVLLAREMEVGVERMEPGALRGYFERRVPLGESRLLAHFATLVAHLWELAETGRAAQLHAAVAAAAAFLEQTALDGGRLEVAWLLTGLPAPTAGLGPRPGRPEQRPGSALVHPKWISANLEYLRDLDYLGSRTGAGSAAASSSQGAPPPTGPPAPRAPRPAPTRPVRKKGGGGQGGPSAGNL